MAYNRYQRVERIASDPLEFTARTSRSGSSCCDELTSVRLLIESVSGVLAQVSHGASVSISDTSLVCFYPFK